MGDDTRVGIVMGTLKPCPYDFLPVRSLQYPSTKGSPSPGYSGSKCVFRPRRVRDVSRRNMDSISHLLDTQNLTPSSKTRLL